MAGNVDNIDPETKIDSGVEVDIRPLAAVLDAVNGLFCIHDTQGRIVYMNPKFRSLIGYGDAELKGIKTSDLTLEHHKRLLQERLSERLQQGEESSWELPIKTRDGRELIVAARTSPLYQGGWLVGEILLYEDITERKRAEEDLRLSHQRLKAIFDGMISALAVTTEKRDQYTAGHQIRVAALAVAIAKELDLDERVLDDLRIAGTLHDIGKLYVPLDILTQPGPLSKIQREYVQIHPEAGYDILNRIPFVRPIAEIVLQHHERLDGSGYPRGLSGEQIMLEARLLAVADVVEAMASHRPYRVSLGMERALQEIEDNAGQRYDAKVVQACIKIIRESDFHFPSGL